MTTTEFKIHMKIALDNVDNKKEVLITRGGKVYKIVRVN
jgi:hypothetical protein